MKINREMILNWAGRAIFERGEDYAEKGRVLKIAYKNGILSGEVQGSQFNKYQVKILIDKEHVRSRCSCPYDWGSFCKHSVAMLLRFLDSNISHQHNSLGQHLKTDFQQEHSRISFSKLKFNGGNGRDLAWGESKPIVVIVFPGQGILGGSSKGIKFKIYTEENGQREEIYQLGQILSLKNSGYMKEINPNQPALNSYQKHILELLNSFADWDYGYYLKPIGLSVLLQELKGEGVVLFKGKARLKICRDKTVPMGMRVKLTKKEMLSVVLFSSHPEKADELFYGNVIDGRPCWVFDEQTSSFYRFPEPFDRAALISVFNYHGEALFSQKLIPEILREISINFKDYCQVEYQSPELQQAIKTGVAPKVQLYVDNKNGRLTIDPKVVYGEHVLLLDDILQPNNFYSLKPLQWFTRDLKQEYELFQFLNQDCGLVMNRGTLTAKDSGKIIDLLTVHLPKVSEQYEVFTTPAVKEIYDPSNHIIPRVDIVTDGIDWFHFKASCEFGDTNEKISFKEIEKQLLQSKDVVQLKSGKLVKLSTEFVRGVRDFVYEYGGFEGRLGLYHMPFFVEQSSRQQWSIGLDDTTKKLFQELQNFESIASVPAPAKLQGVLRDYQKKGLEWLEFLRHFRFGGILADEMGLGKTLQVLALIERHLTDKECQPSLVVCPTTLVLNWQAEVKKFLPHLKIIVIYGSARREMFQNISKADLIITSYALLRRDIELYSEREFNYVILDEAQNIKNRNTINARMTKSLKSRYRLVLTGTPLENSVADIWSLFDFLMPGFLGSYERFRNFYEIPILKWQDNERLTALARKIKPFLLRRLKREVIRELPSKIEQVSFCEMEAIQHRTYQKMLEMAQKKVLDAYRKKGFQKSQMMILTVLLRLRQICCHPELAGVRLGHRLMVSAKLNMLKELVADAMSGNHKILVFTQFVGMISIMEDYFRKNKIEFESLHGKTKDRQGCIERFNQDPQKKVFLLSLKVGGVGLNLTSANTVIIYEPWWNPAVEDQAIDRAHRIGQRNAVTAYKLITQGTIEEKILELQKRKKNLIDSLVVSEEGIAKKIGWEDIKFLLDIKE